MELRIFDFNDGFLRKKIFLNNEKKVLPVIIHVPKSLGNRLESKERFRDLRLNLPMTLSLTSKHC